jgi:hypothetical protein
MLRMTVTVALLGALLVVLHATSAVANVFMSAAATPPATDTYLTWTPGSADPTVGLALPYPDQYTCRYTVTDHDTFTSSYPPPPPQPPPYGAFSHDDNVEVTTPLEVWSSAPNVFQCVGAGGGGAHEYQYDVWVRNMNETGVVQSAYFRPTFDDQALPPMGVDEDHRTGSADDVASVTFYKNFVLGR